MAVSFKSTKSQTLFWMIDEAKNFHKIYLYAKKLDEPLYEWFIDELGTIIEYSSSTDDIIDTSSVNDTEQNLVILSKFLESIPL